MQDKDSNSPAAAVFVDVDQLQETSYVTRNDNNTPSTDNKSENQSIVSVQDDVFTSKNSKPQKPLAEVSFHFCIYICNIRYHYWPYKRPNCKYH